MIHDVIVSLLNPDLDNLPITDLLMANTTNDILHSSEMKILQNILDINNQHKEISKIIKQYSATGHHCQQTCSNGINGQDIEEPLQKGLYLQSICTGISNALIPFRQSIVELEERYLKTPSFSLIFIFQKIQEYKTLLVFLLRFINGIKSQRIHGCALLQYLQQHALNGDKSIMDAIQIIQKSVHNIFLKQLSQWIVFGKLADEYGEFFIQQIEYKVSNAASFSGGYRSVGGGGGAGIVGRTSTTTTPTTVSDGATSVNMDLWRYEICYELLPHYFTPIRAEKVLFIGQMVVMFNLDPNETVKRTNIWNQDDIEMIQRGGSLWNNQEHIYFSKLQQIFYNPNINITEFEQVIDEIKLYVSGRLSEIALNQADLIKQLKLIKEFYLLGRGELFLEFIKQTKSIRVKMNNNNIDETITRDISKAFETAANIINIGDDLDKFSLTIPMDYIDQSTTQIHNLSQILQHSDGFIQLLHLRYKVKWPLHLLFSPKQMSGYNEMFRFLLQIKKIQYSLHTVWCHHRENKMKKNSRLLQLRNKLMFLIDNLQYYLQVDVLEGQFSILMDTVQTSKDFEHIQRAHAIFQANILSLCFLLPTCFQSMTASVALNKTDLLNHHPENPVLTILNRMLTCCRNFCQLSLKCKLDKMTRYEQKIYTQCELQFNECISNLMKLLSGLNAGPSSTPLAQLLLRLDYNYYFSSMANKTTDDDDDEEHDDDEDLAMDG